MDVLSRGDPYQEFRKGEGLENLQTSSARGGGGGEFGSAAAAVPNVVAAVRGGRPFVPSISGGFTFQKSSDIQEVPSWSVNRSTISRKHSSEEDVGFRPAASQEENGSFTPHKVPTSSHQYEYLQ
jgi:hypothetical protein